MNYRQEELFRLARRYRNAKRSYLLVNPLQGKHIPVLPSKALQMMDALSSTFRARMDGDMSSASDAGATEAEAEAVSSDAAAQDTVKGIRIGREAHSETAGAGPDGMHPQADGKPTHLVIGFAETATAIGGVLAASLGAGCRYLTTTREEVPGAGEWIDFREEHSHAAEQKLCVDGLDEWFNGGAQLILVDDELSTGKTLRNIASGLRARFPVLAEQRFHVVSVINRLNAENMALLAGAGIDCTWLLRLPEEDYSAAVAAFYVEAAASVQGAELPRAQLEYLPVSLPSPMCRNPSADRQCRGNASGRQPESVEHFTDQEGGQEPAPFPHIPDVRRGVDACAYFQSCQAMAQQLAQTEPLRSLAGQRVRVLGTEEFMLPALLLGCQLESIADVRFHATTRSPIGISNAPGYPFTNGCRLRSLYDAARETYIYNLAPCDATVLFTDALLPADGLDDLRRAIRCHGCERLIAIGPSRS